MARINITTATTTHNPSKQEAVGMFMIETIGAGGLPITEDKYLYRESITGVELTLQLLANALTIVSRKETEYDSVDIYVDEPIVDSAFRNNWIEKWEHDKWLNAKGKEVAHADIWQMIWELMSKIGKRYIVMVNESSYTSYMHFKCDKELEKVYERRKVDEHIRRIKEKLDGNDKA